MNGKRWLIVLMMALAAGLAFTGCEDDDDDHPLVGTWNTVTVDGDALPTGATITITIRNNGTGEVRWARGDDALIRTFTWSERGGVLTIVQDGDTETVPYVLAGRTLTMTIEGDVWVLNRQ